MFQDFDQTANPEAGPARLAALRAAMQAAGVTGFLVPRADRFQGEYVAPCDERLAWLTGFTGSFGICVALMEAAGLFVDSRYRLQVRAQTDPVFSPLSWPEERPIAWILSQISEGVIGYDPMLHACKEIDAMQKELADQAISLRPVENLIDTIWSDRPSAPNSAAFAYPEALAGLSAARKRAERGAALVKTKVNAALITQPDSIAWLLNLRGGDVRHVPIMHAMALLHEDGRVDLFADPRKLADLSLGEGVRIAPEATIEETLKALHGRVLIDPKTCPVKLRDALCEGNVSIQEGDDPCLMPKACKNAAEISAARRAHARDAVAMCRFLTWLDTQIPGAFTEIDAVVALETCRQETGALRDISFDTISGSGPNGAIVHYRVTHESNRVVQDGDVLLIDSGGQYEDGTTDITRTIAIGAVPQNVARAYTRVLQGVIAISQAHWPKGLSGAALDPFARRALWQAGQDYGHGTGHGVGAYLSVHEGPQCIARGSEVPLQPGMILSNEPGYYQEGAFGIRIENLVVVQEAELEDDASVAALYCFETLTCVPLETELIVTSMLSDAERDWINTYHRACRAIVEGYLDSKERIWLEKATRMI